MGKPCVLGFHFALFGRLNVYDSVPYAALARVFSLIEATTKRIEKTSLLTAFLLLVIQRSAKGDTKSLLQAVYLCINRVSFSHILIYAMLKPISSSALIILAWNSALVKVCSSRRSENRQVGVMRQSKPI